MNILTRTCCYLLGWLVLFGMARPDIGREVRAQGTSPEAIASARARWETLSPLEKVRMKRRFEQLQKLDSTQRTQLQERTQRRRQQEERALAQLSTQERKRLGRLAPEQRHEVITELVDQERRDKGRRIESKLPNSIRGWLRNASPKDRQAKLESFKQQTRSRISARAVEDFAKALGYGEGEIKRLERLPMHDRMATVMRLRKQLTANQLEESGLPQEFTEQRWNELEALPAEDFLREVWSLQSQGVLSGLINPAEHPQQGARLARRKAAGEIRKAMRIHPDQLLDLSGLSRPERRKRIAHYRRVQTVAALREHEFFAPARLQELELLDDEEFIGRVRALLDESMGPRRGKRVER